MQIVELDAWTNMLAVFFYTAAVFNIGSSGFEESHLKN